MGARATGSREHGGGKAPSPRTRQSSASASATIRPSIQIYPIRSPAGILRSRSAGRRRPSGRASPAVIPGRRRGACRGEADGPARGERRLARSLPMAARRQRATTPAGRRVARWWARRVPALRGHEGGAAPRAVFRRQGPAFAPRHGDPALPSGLRTGTVRELTGRSIERVPVRGASTPWLVAG